jgi:hypothetical protein
VNEPIRPVGPRPALQPPVAPGQMPVAHRRRREEDAPEEREHREPREDAEHRDDAPDADGHIDVLA